MWSSGWEDALFKRAPEGWTFNSPYPRIFSQRRWTYLLTDVEKERLAGRLRRFLPLVQALVLGVCVLAAVPLAFWLPLPDLVRQLVVGSPGARLLLSLVMLDPPDRSQPRPLVRPIPCGSPHRSRFASTTRPVRHSVPS